MAASADVCPRAEGWMARVKRRGAGSSKARAPGPAGRATTQRARSSLWALLLAADMSLVAVNLARLYRGRGLAAAIGVSFEVLRVFASSLWNAVCVVVGRGAEEGGASLDVYDLTVQASNMPSLDGHNVPSLAEM